MPDEYITIKLYPENDEGISLEIIGESENAVTLEPVPEGSGQHYEVYPGAYEVNPDVVEQVLDTAWKLMTDDLVVHKIPYFEESNASGGTTVYIAYDAAPVW